MQRRIEPDSGFHRREARAGCVLVLLLGGCAMSFELPDGGDAGGFDGGRVDVSTPDGGLFDAGPPDVLDAGPADGGPVDAELIDDAPVDGGVDAARIPCVTDRDCDVVWWCVAPPRCDPGSEGADPWGCVHYGPRACPPGFSCDRSLGLCAPCADADLDGYASAACGGSDCDDSWAGTNPGQVIDGCDGADSDCDGMVDEDPEVALYVDADGDGRGSDDFNLPIVLSCLAVPGYAAVRGDCADGVPSVYVGAPELCDGFDNDCNFRIDGPGEDDDRDGYIDVACTADRPADCNDEDPAIRPGALEILCDGIDQDCDGSTGEDLDADGVLGPPCGADCDDFDASIGTRDEDGDGHAPTETCYSGIDCDDADPMTHPGVVEICNRESENCVWASYGEDWDLDGYASLEMVCRDDVPGALPRRDCNDHAPSIAPGRAELCDTIDNDCDPVTADGTAVANGCLPGYTCRDGACRQAVALAGASYSHTCAILVDGSVRCWGGVACPEPSRNGGCFTPYASLSWSDVAALDPEAVCMLDHSGRIFDSRGNELLGYPPARVLGTRCACVARADTGGLWCTGVGDLPGPTDVVQVEDGCARTRSGEVWCWGSNRYGEIGDGTTVDRPLPVRVMIGAAIDLATGGSGRQVALADGTVMRWGRGTLSPVGVPGLVGVTEIAIDVALRGAADAQWIFGPTIPGTSNLHGLVGPGNRGCAFTEDGRVICFGSVSYAEIGVPYPAMATGPVTVGTL